MACVLPGGLRTFVGTQWPTISHSARIEKLQAAQIAPLISEAGASAVLLIGGPPCQPFSGLGKAPRGFQDERSSPIREFIRIRDELAALCSEHSLDFHWLMEEVASMSAKHRQEITEMTGAKPTLLHAADFGTIRRARLHWGLDLRSLGGELGPVADAKNIEFLPPGCAAEDLAVIRWCGKPVPESWTPGDGYEWKHRSSHGVVGCTAPGTRYSPTYPEGRFAALTTIFLHPADRPPKESDDPHLLQRFLDDGRRRPLFAYAKGNMVWKGAAARPLSVEESEEVMGFPRGYTAKLDSKGRDSRENARLHALGNTFHVPSIVILLALLFNPLAPSDAALQESFLCSMAPGREDRDAWERRFAEGTVWDEDIIRNGAKMHANIVEEACALFDPAMIQSLGSGPVCRAMAAFAAIPLLSLNNFSMYLERVGAPATATGPDLQALWTKSPMHAAVGKQHRPSTANAVHPPISKNSIGGK